MHQVKGVAKLLHDFIFEEKIPDDKVLVSTEKRPREPAASSPAARPAECPRCKGAGAVLFRGAPIVCPHPWHRPEEGGQ